ncbi:TPA: hypothetical protein ACX3CU_004689, partial [Vibrio parahaemolyticus]|uniref:hypothetical protein n=1 Tax=Vibrio parahaemolyticus TaxID=670 RepID=UPI00193FD99D
LHGDSNLITSIDSKFIKFSQHVQPNEDMTALLLKGHLLAEEILREMLYLNLKKPEALKGSQGTRFDFHQVVCLVEATSNISESKNWIWSASKKINKVRNTLAHNLEPDGLDHRLSDFIKIVESNSMDFMFIRERSKPSEFNPVKAALLALCSELSYLSESLKNEA